MKIWFYQIIMSNKIYEIMQFIKNNVRNLFKKMGTIPKYQCGGKCALTAKPAPEVLDQLETGFRKLAESDSKSLLRKYLTREVFDNLKFKKTKFGSTLLDCIQSGYANHDSGIGVYAPDPDAYTTFADLFDPIIEEYHNGFKKTDVHPPLDFGDLKAFVNLDPTGTYVVSTRVRLGRTVDGFPFNPTLQEQQYKDLEKKIGVALASLEGEIKGNYHPLVGMDADVQKKLIDSHYLFKEGDRFLKAANALRYWPVGRGIYYNEEKTFVVWVNEEDHMRVISMQNGGDLGAVYRRFVNAMNELAKKLTFVRHERLGFLTFCPTNLGTCVRASVHIKVPKLAKNKKKLDEIAAKYSLQVRGSTGEHTEAVGGIYDISNKQRMGITEFNAIKIMQDGILEMIKLEKSIKDHKKREPTWRELARRRLKRNPFLERLKWPKFLPAHLYKI